MVDCLGGPASGATLEQLWSNVAEAAVQSFGLSLEGTCVRFVSCFFHNVVQLFLEATWLCDVLGYTLLGNLRSKVTHCIDLLDRLCKISGPTAVHFYGVAVWQHPWLKSLIFIEGSFSIPFFGQATHLKHKLKLCIQFYLGWGLWLRSRRNLERKIT